MLLKSQMLLRSHKCQSLCKDAGRCAKARLSQPEVKSRHQTVTKSPQMKSQKILSLISRFREIAINLSLILIAVACISRGSKPDPFRKLHWKTSIAGHVIFESDVTPLTPVLTVYWQGDFFTRTQQVVLTSVGSLQYYRQQPKDMLGWVW